MSSLIRVLAASLCLLGPLPTVQAAERALNKEVVVNAGVDQLWDTWTGREGPTSFFAPDARIEPRVGGAFQIYMGPGAEPGVKGADVMRYLALQPRKMITFD